MLSLSNLLVEDIIYPHIFPYLEVGDLLNLREALSDFKIIVDTYLSQMKKINWHTVPASQMTMAASKTKSLISLDFVDVMELSDLTIATLLKRNRKIQRIVISDYSNLSQAGVRQIAFLKHLTALSLPRNQWVNNRFLHLLTGFLNVKQLKKIDFSGCRPNDWALINFFQKFTWLEDISLVDCPHLTFRVIRAIGENIPTLIYLRIGWNTLISESSIRHVLKKCPAIKGIDVTGCEMISQEFKDTHLKNILME